ncbi:MAG: hypothetical protein ACI9F9_003390 [Candidatus Paceibacteria bacterium]|jgi:hypothetical protein
MFRYTPLLLLSVILPACGGDESSDPETTSDEPEVITEAPQVEITNELNPLTGQTVQTVRITELPSDEFFQSYAYPEAKVLDVKEVFGTPTVWFSSTDGFEAVDAFYKAKFTSEDGTLEGHPGTYYRMTKNNRMEKASFKQTSTGCEIVLAH